MYKTNDPNQRESKSATPRMLPGDSSKIEFKTLSEFEQWLENELDVLVACFSDFETQHSLRGFFQRN
jgi:hypothetical protein